MAQVNVRVDDSIKKKAENACAAMGLTMTAAINIFLTKVANERRIPFDITADPFYNEENLDELAKRADDMRAGLNMHEHELIEVD